MKRGFTLVELSIVLVIIGLLIGGILVAQSMIETSRIQAQVRQFGQFDAAVADFVSKYIYPPGDVRSLYTPSEAASVGVNVEGDGLITDYANLYPLCVYYNVSSEMSYFWTQLSRGSDFTQNGISYVQDATNGFAVTGAAPNSPQSPLEKNSGFIVASTNMLNGDSMTAYQMGNYSTLTGASGHAGVQGNLGTSITPIQARALDLKMDDGLPGTGSVRASGLGATSTPFARGALSSTCASGGVYANSNTKACGVVVEVMSQAGGIPSRGTTY